MDRPQWLFRRGTPFHTFRWRPKEWKVSLFYNTLDVAADDTDNFFKVVGQPLEEPTFREMLSAADYRRRHSVSLANKRRIAAIAEHVQEYLQIKEWRIRLRRAVSDLEWNFEPYRKHYEEVKKQREKEEAQRKLKLHQERQKAVLEQYRTRHEQALHEQERAREEQMAKLKTPEPFNNAWAERVMLPWEDAKKRFYWLRTQGMSGHQVFSCPECQRRYIANTPNFSRQDLTCLCGFFIETEKHGCNFVARTKIK